MPSLPRICIVVAFAGLFVVYILRMGRHFLFQHADVIDTHRTRIPLLLATATAMFFCLAGAVFGVGAIVMGLTTASMGMIGPVIGVAALLPAFCAVTSYVLAIRLSRRKLHWRPCGDGAILAKVDTIAARMGLTDRPKVVISERLSLPLVLGRGARSSFLVLPARWTHESGQLPSQEEENAREFQIYHELAHIRNRDVRFTTWAHVFVRTMAPTVVMILAIATVVIAGGGMHALPVTAVLGLPLAGYLFLCVLYHVVLRQREFDADSRAAAASGWSISTLRPALSRTDPVYMDADRDGDRTGKASRRWRLDLWCSDKSAFGKPRVFWRVVTRLCRLALRTHPSLRERLQKIGRAEERKPWACPPMGFGVLVGVASGLFVLGLLYSVVMPVLMVPEHSSKLQGYLAEEVALPFWSMACVTILSLGLANLAMLPARFSDEAGKVPWVYPLQMAKWLLAVMLTALATISVAWPVFIELAPIIVLSVSFAFIAGAVLSTLSGTMRAFGRVRTDMWLAAIITLCLFGAGGIGHLLIPGFYLPIACGILVEAVLAFQPKDKTSLEEGYASKTVLGRTFVIEGLVFRRRKLLFDCLVHVLPGVACGLLAAVVYCIWRGDHIYENLSLYEHLMGMAGLLVIALVGILHIARRAGGLGPHRLEACSKCTELLLRWAPAFPAGHGDVLRKMISIVESQDDDAGYVDLTEVKTQYYLLPCLEATGQSADASLNLVGRILHCECRGGGFAVWPGASARLSSTFQALRTLEQLGRLDVIDLESHWRWLLGLRQIDGCFRDPILEYPTWKQTYWGLICCEILANESVDPLPLATERAFQSQLGRALSHKRIAEEVFMVSWVLKSAGALERDIEERVAALAEQRLVLLAEMRTTWVIDEYVAIMETGEISSVVADRVRPHVARAARRIVAALGGLLGPVAGDSGDGQKA